MILWNQGISLQDKEGSINDYRKVPFRFTVDPGEDMNTYTDGSSSAPTSIDILASLNSRIIFKPHAHILKMAWFGKPCDGLFKVDRTFSRRPN